MQFRREAAFGFGGTELFAFLFFLCTAPFLLGNLGFKSAATLTQRNNLLVHRPELFSHSLTIFANVR